MRPLIAGNWKMYGNSASLAEIEAIATGVADSPPPAEVLVCPPATLISRATEIARGRFGLTSGSESRFPEYSPRKPWNSWISPPQIPQPIFGGDRLRGGAEAAHGYHRSAETIGAEGRGLGSLDE